MSLTSFASGSVSTVHQLKDEQYLDCNDIRTSFTVAMSAMYRNEVPLYGDLVRIVQNVNSEVLKGLGEGAGLAESERLDLERHGAIRLGTPYELRTICRLFALLGLNPVGYYDLSEAGLPMHATCFRPTEKLALEKNPFRVFTTLLRPELLQDEGARNLAMRLLGRRNIFSDELLELLDTAEKQDNRLRPDQAEAFIIEAMKTFSWKPVASASESEYKKLVSEHPILADIASFKSSHINHLTPRTLDITASQKQMKAEGLKVKDRIEGPPSRKCPILLRQTSFLALEEPIKFLNSDGILVEGTHRARFGEIEERGAAVTPAGRKLYDRLLNAAMEKCSALDEISPTSMDEILNDVFRAYPDDWSELRKQGLIYCTYQRTAKLTPETLPTYSSLEDLVSEGFLKPEPITYEDFLPFSAAGIFQSNLHAGPKQQSIQHRMGAPDQEGFEQALGSTLLSSDDLYQRAQNQSLEQCVFGTGWSL